MSDQDKVFDSEGTTTTAADTLVGDGKKYATTELALESLVASQEHIAKLEAENQEHRDELAVRASVEDQLKAHTTTETQTQDHADMSFSEEDISKIVNARLTERDSVSTAKTNAKDVQGHLIELFGEDAKAKFEEKSKELGVDLNSLAAKSPAVVKGLFAAVKTESSSTSSSMSSDSLGNSSQGSEEPRKPLGSRATTQERVSAWNACAPKT